MNFIYLGSYLAGVTQSLSCKYTCTAWPIFHGPFILPYILKAVWWMSIIFWDGESVWQKLHNNQVQEICPSTNNVIRQIICWSTNLTICESINLNYHTCEPLLMDMREIWFSFQGDWRLHQGDYSTAFLTRRFKLFSIKLKRNFKKYMNYSTLLF